MAGSMWPSFTCLIADRDIRINVVLSIAQSRRSIFGQYVPMDVQCPCGLRVKSLRIVAGIHQERGGAVRPDTDAGGTVGRGGQQHGHNLLVQFSDLRLLSLDAVGQSMHDH